MLANSNRDFISHRLSAVDLFYHMLDTSFSWSGLIRFSVNLYLFIASGHFMGEQYARILKTLN